MLSVILEGVVQVSVASKMRAWFADLLQGHVILKIGVLDCHLTAQETNILWMDHHVTMMRPIATQENARHMMHSAKHIS